MTPPDTESLIPGLTGDYLGQPLPGTEPRRFAPQVIPFDGMFQSVTVAPDGQEIYWAESRGIVFTRRVDGGWTTPALVSFSGTGGEAWMDDAPVLSPDNSKLFFNSRRRYDFNPTGAWKFWFATRTVGGWGTPEPMPEVINSTGGIHWQASVANSGTFYFGVLSQTQTGLDFSVYSSRFVDGVYTTPESFDAINGFGDGVCPFIAPDESYIVFNRVVDPGPQSDGYYVSFQGRDGGWSAPQRLPQLPGIQESSFVTRDGRFLFAKGYWVSAQIIEELRPR